MGLRRSVKKAASKTKSFLRSLWCFGDGKSARSSDPEENRIVLPVPVCAVASPAPSAATTTTNTKSSRPLSRSQEAQTLNLDFALALASAEFKSTASSQWTDASVFSGSSAARSAALSPSASASAAASVSVSVFSSRRSAFAGPATAPAPAPAAARSRARAPVPRHWMKCADRFTYEPVPGCRACARKNIGPILSQGSLWEHTCGMKCGNAVAGGFVCEVLVRWDEVERHACGAEKSCGRCRVLVPAAVAAEHECEF